MPFLHSDILCPYCLQELRSKDLKMKCNLCGTEAKPSRLDLMTNRSPKCAVPGCHGYASDRYCNYCDSKLPSDILDYKKNLRFSLLGIPGAGKTNFLTTMLHEMRNAPNNPWVLSPMDNQTSEMFRRHYDAVYNERRPVEPTPPGMQPPPQLWRIRDKSRMRGSIIPSYSMTIFDGAGEDGRKIDPVISRYINGSKALVILIDPLALPRVARAISRNLVNWSSTSAYKDGDTIDMVDELANYVRANCGIRGNEVINRDVAVVFSKIDLVRQSFGSATVMQSSPHMARHAFVKSDADAVDMEIRDWLASHGESAFLEAIDTNFRADRVRYFGVSSFGQPPTGSQQLGQIIPHRVLDPLMWMLAKEGVAPTV